MIINVLRAALVITTLSSNDAQQKIVFSFYNQTAIPVHVIFSKAVTDVEKKVLHLVEQEENTILITVYWLFIN